MTATIIVGVLCLHLLCFAGVFWLIGTRLQGKRLGMDVFALGNAMLGLAYVLQWLGGPPGWGALSVLNHTLTVCVPLVYWVGGLRFFGRDARLLQPLLALAIAYTAAQFLMQWLVGPTGRYAMLSFTMAVELLAMVAAIRRAMQGVGKDLRVELALFALLTAGLGILNAIKCMLVAQGGLPALAMGSRFQVVFYVYMSILTTILAPSMVWLVLRRLTDELRALALRDPLTQLLNRRGLLAELKKYFRLRTARPAYLLMLDIDRFKQINDTHGHQAGDAVLSQLARVLHQTLRGADIACRTGGEEFVVICLETDGAGAIELAERLRLAVEQQPVSLASLAQPLHYTVTIGVSSAFDGPQGLEAAMHSADVALYRGKAAGRNRVEHGSSQAA